MQQYTAKKGYYRKRELSLLATALGFPGTLLVDRFRAHYTENDRAESAKERTVSEKMVARLLSSGALFKKLEKVFNKYPAWYNVKLIRKAMQHLRHRSLSFSDISECRVAFELYAYEDGSGIPAELSHVRQALKMLERIMSPSQLQVEIQRFNEVSDVPSRLQLYEFMDIAAACEKTEVEDERRLSEISLSEGKVASESSCSVACMTRTLSVPDFNQILMTRDQRVSSYLESNYQHSLRRRKESPPPPLDKDRIVHTDSRKSLVSLAAEQSMAVSPCLERSQSQLLRSRNGFYPLSNEHFRSIQSSRQTSPTRLKVPKTTASKRRQIFSTEDPLKKRMETGQSVIQTPVKVRLQQLPLRRTDSKSQPPRNKVSYSSASEGLSKTINDICADSVLRARGALQSSIPVSVISPPNTCRSMSSSNPLRESVPTSRPMVVPPRSSTRKVSRNKPSRGRFDFSLKPIVSKEEREEQQELIDDLLWSTHRSKEHYQAL